MGPMGTRLGWHFLARDRILTHGDDRQVRKNRWMKMKPSLSSLTARAGWQGMHAAPTIMHAVLAAPACVDILCKVRVRGNINHSLPRFCGTHRKVLKWGNVALRLRVFAMRAFEEYIKTLPIDDQPEWNQLWYQKLIDPRSGFFPIGCSDSMAEDFLFSESTSALAYYAIYMLLEIGKSEKAIEARLRRAVKGVLK